MAAQNTCKRCGKCCYIYLPDKEPIKCRWLLKLNAHNGHNGKKTYCRIYKNRIGQRCSLEPALKEYKCTPRAAIPWDYEGCPLNTGKPIIK